MAENFFKHYIYPIATLSGNIIGVGFLALPYIALQVGIWPMLFYFIALTSLVIFVHVIFGRICLKTPDFKRWPGFVGFYLGRWTKMLVLPLMISGSVGILLVYLIIGGQFLSELLLPIFGGVQINYVLLYFAAASIFVYFGVTLISKIDVLALLVLCSILLIIFFKGSPYIHLDNIFTSSSNFQFSRFFLPYGAILFSLWGTGLIPEVEEMLRGNKKSLSKVIIASILIPALIYFVFIFLILGITGPATTSSALLGLKNVLGDGIVSVALFMGVITTFIAFIAQGLLLKKVFMYDVGVKEFPAWIFACFTPLILFLLGLNSFINLISFVGGFLLGIEGILIMLIYKKIGGKPIVVYPLMLVFILGIVYSLVYFIS